MSSSYSVSTSENGSFSTSPALHQPSSRHSTSGAAAGGAGSVHVDAAATASTTRSDVTPKKASQSSKSAANTTQESPSMTIRRVPADYSKRMEDQKARSNALERYKMLVKGNRLVPSEGEASPSPVKVKRTEAGDDAATPNTSTRRSGQQLQLAYSANRDGSTLSRTVVSDDSDMEDEEEGLTRFSQNRKSADPRPPPRSMSRRQQEQMAATERRAGSSSSPVSVSVSVERPAYPHSAVVGRQRSEPAAAAVAAPAPVVLPGLNLAQTIPHLQQQQPSMSTMDADTKPYSIPGAENGEEEEDGIDYVAPELTQPFGSSKQLRPRSAIRPGYEPVTARGRSSFQRTASASGEPQQQQQQQPRSQVQGHSSITRSRADISPSGTNTPRRKSTAKAQAAEERPVAAQLFPDEEDAEQQQQPANASESHREGAAHERKPKEAGDVVPLPGSKTAFWLRPSSAMYEMTTSVAAKRKDHNEQEGFQRTNSSSHTSRSYHYTPSGTTASNCGTPRGTPRGRPSHAAAAAEKKPRFSTHVTAADRKLYEEGGAAAAVATAKATAPPTTAPSTYDAIFSNNNRQSAVQRGSTQRTQKAAATTTTAQLDMTATSSVVSGSTPRNSPRGAPRGSSQHRAAAAAQQRLDSLRSPSTYSRLNSNQPISPSNDPTVEAGRVSTRQQGALAKHCARVAASGGAVSRADDAASSTAPSEDAAAAKKAKRKTTASPAPPAPQAKKRLSAAPAAPAPQYGATRQPKANVQPARPAVDDVPASPDVHKRLEYEIADEPVPRTTVPRSSKRILAPADEAADDVNAAAPAAEEEQSPHTTIHGRRAGEDDTPSKSRRREHDVVASPPRNDEPQQRPPRLHHQHQPQHRGHASPNAAANTAAAARSAEDRFAAQDAAMEREKEQARALQTREAMESCRLARQARIEAARTSHAVGATAVAPGTSVSTNEVVAAMLQGIVQQTRHTLPCFLCGEQQSTSGYKVHVGLCRPKTEGLLREYFTTIAGLPDIPSAVQERISRMAALEVPLSTSEPAVRDAFAKECYQCVKSMLVPCRKCGTQLRVHDVKEHEMLCGREYYRNSRAAERVRSTVERIERGAQE